MKEKPKKLEIRKITLRDLDESSLLGVAGAASETNCVNTICATCTTERQTICNTVCTTNCGGTC